MKSRLSKDPFAKERQALFDGIGTPEPKPFKPDHFQLSAIESLAEGNDTLVVAPTGTGKTYIAVEGIRQTIASGKRAIYTAPLKALSNTKYGEFKRLFEPEYRVGLLTGDRKIEGDANVVVATTEIYRNELFRSTGNYSLVVLDEFHYLSDPQRGPVWEESIILSPLSASLLMLSASISNAETIATWIRSIRNKPVKIISETQRPVALRMAFLHPRYGILPLESNSKEIKQAVAEVYRSPRRHFSAPATGTVALGPSRRSPDDSPRGRRSKPGKRSR
jgi:ATP-dependent RNA helicase HelY